MPLAGSWISATKSAEYTIKIIFSHAHRETPSVSSLPLSPLWFSLQPMVQEYLAILLSYDLPPSPRYIARIDKIPPMAKGRAVGGWSHLIRQQKARDSFNIFPL
jgi:hypothetical protein